MRGEGIFTDVMRSPASRRVVTVIVPRGAGDSVRHSCGAVAAAVVAADPASLIDLLTFSHNC